MEIIFYYNQSDERNINKILIDGETLQGEMRGECSVMQPVMRVASNDPIRYNYCYIPEFQRYYAVTEISAYRTGLWEVSLDCDVLMSFRNEIMNLNAVVERQSSIENGDEYIDDSSLVANSYMFTTVYDYPAGFNDTGTYILVTAG